MTARPIHHRTELLVGPAVLERLQRSRAIIFGVGGVGSWCAEGLVRSGVGHLTIVDSDLVCVTNINRQLQATSANVGHVKVFELEQRLKEIDPATEIAALQKIYEDHNAADFDLGAYDYVIDAIDSLSSKVHLIEHATALGATVYSAMGAACKLDPTRIKVASIWKTDNCPLAREVRRRLRRRGFDGDVLCVYSDENLLPQHDVETACGTARCMCPKHLGADDTLGFTHEWCSTKARINGSVVHMTAIFGMHLTGLVVQDAVRRAKA